MIFVTVGTHEQQFNRLIEYMDNWAQIHNDEDVFIQTGFSTYKPKFAKYKEMLPYNIIVKYVTTARIVITHGGPSSFLLPVHVGKIPIVIPRNSAFAEHVNNHQISFCKKVSEIQNNIVVVEDIDNLDATIENYSSIISKMNYKQVNNNQIFCDKLEKIVDELLGYNL